jgi:hypothetical protein
VTTKGLRRAAGGLLALLVVGCGLSTYEDGMRATRKRVERYDEELPVLGDPVTPPVKRVVTKEPAPKAEAGKDPKKGAPKETVKEEKKPVIDYPFFFRPPRGIRSTPDADPVNGLAYHYSKAGGALAIPGVGGIPAAPKGGVGPAEPAGALPVGFTDLYLAFSNEPAGIFADKVVKALKDFYHGTDPVTAKQRAVDVPDRKEPLNFEMREFNDAQTAWTVFAHSESGQTVAIVYRTEKARKGALDRPMELSLATLAMGAEASWVANSYAKRR